MRENKCSNCGASMKDNVCEYCGTVYKLLDYEKMPPKPIRVINDLGNIFINNLGCFFMVMIVIAIIVSIAWF